MKRTFLPFLLVALSGLPLTAGCGDDDASESSSTFSLTASSATLEVTPGSSTKVTITAAGAPSAVDLSLANLPLGVAGTFSPASTSTSSELTFTVANDVAPGSFPIGVRGRAGSASGSVDVTVTVKAPAAAFSLTLAPASLELGQGRSGFAQVDVTRNGGFSGPIDVTITGLPVGVTAAPITIPEGANSGALTLTASGAATPGATTALGVHGASGDKAADATLSLKVVGLSGGLDTTFGEGGKAVGTVLFPGGRTMQVSHHALQSDGKIVAVGYVSNGANNDFAVVRYNADGTPDTGFGTAGYTLIDFGNQEYGRDLAIQADGKIVVVGYSQSQNDIAMARLGTDGKLDTTFGTAGRYLSGFAGSDLANAVTLQADGKIVVAGQRDGLHGVGRYNADGTVDTTFGTGGFVTVAAAGAAVDVAVQPDGKIVAISTTNDIVVTRFSAAGVVDADFGTSGLTAVDFAGFGDEAGAVTLQADGKIVVVGTAALTSNFRRVAVIRLLASGALDTSFDTDGKVTVGGPSGDRGLAVAIQADGKILAAGMGTYTGSSTDFYVARLTTSGALDPSFDDDGRFYANLGSYQSWVTDLFLQADGRILAAGWVYYPIYQSGFVRIWP